nr:transposase, MuDR [Tanacetum cinerariifolium]
MVVPLYNIRDNGVHDRDPYKMYKPDSNLFSIKLHYGGVFTISPNRKYNNDNITFVDLIDSDQFLQSEEERHSEEETEVEDEIDSEDSDYLVDEDNNVDDVDVEMEDFEYNIDEAVEFVGCKDRNKNLILKKETLRK